MKKYLLLLILPISVVAMPHESISQNITYNGLNTYVSDETINNKLFESNLDNQNTILITNGTVNIDSSEINKEGNSNSEQADFYGTNASILVTNGTLNLNASTVNTNGLYANAIFSYDKGIINIKDTKINTLNNTSGGIMVAGGGTINATNLDITTNGNSSASIRSDRGGGTITVNKGNYTTNGIGSPAIYSTAKITVNNANLTSNKSEGIVIEGNNSVELNNTTLTAINTELNGESKTYKNIFLYQSMSGDAESGTSSFTANNSKIISSNEDTFYVTNTTATINLNGNEIINPDGSFLNIEASSWGKSGSNGGNVTLNLDNQTIESNDIKVDKYSMLTINMTNNSVLDTRINNSNAAKYIVVTLSSDSKLKLEGDTYINSLNNEDKTNSNIDLNGYKLYINN